MKLLQAWPEPILRVQSLSESGIGAIPERYVKPLSERPCFGSSPDADINIPIVDLSAMFSGNSSDKAKVMEQISNACREWGFFQVVNHGVSPQLMERMRGLWRDFFHLPLEEKQAYANSPATYEGYGSRLGVGKGSKLDWGDYFFLHYFPQSLRDQNKWPSLPTSIREVSAEYGDQLVKLGGKLMRVFSSDLGLEDDHLEKAFGGEDKIGVCLRVNYYPKCPQPDLTLGLSSHSDPGGMTLLHSDDHVYGLQVRRGHEWVTVKPVPNAFIVNIGDQIQVLSNATYKSVEHRVTVNSKAERLSLALFYNPDGNTPIKPADKFVSQEKPALYPEMTYNQYRLFIRTQGPCGKSQVESLKLSLQ